MIEAVLSVARHEPGVDVVLFAPAMPRICAATSPRCSAAAAAADREKLKALFGHLTAGIGLDSPEGPAPR